jgi:hypothetical protein
MSRRILLTPRQGQLRAASRMTPGTKMWSEQPVGTRKERLILPVEREGIVPVPLLPPESLRYLEFGADVTGTGQSAYLSLFAGEQAIIVVASQTGQPITVNTAGWTLLAATSGGGVDSAVVTRIAPANETILVASVGPETHPFNQLHARGLAFTSLSTYNFEARLKGQSGGDPVIFTAWGGFPETYHLRVLVSRGAYGGWGTPGAQHGAGGLLSPTPDWWNWGGWSPSIEAYLLGTWNSGAFYAAGGGGIIGPRAWCEWHIRMGG